MNSTNEQVYRIKPLEWKPGDDDSTEHERYRSWRAETPFGEYDVGESAELEDGAIVPGTHEWSVTWSYPGYIADEAFSCEDFEDGKRKAAQHYHERLTQALEPFTRAALNKEENHE